MSAAAPTEPAPAAPPASRRLAGGIGWSISEFTCTAGPGDRPFEERHEAASMAAVLSGSFNYASERGRALLHPGALLLGNPGACYCCGHDHGTGDRCISVQVAPDYFAEIAATAAGSARFRFPAVMLPARRDILPQAVLMTAAAAGDPLAVEERVVALASAAIRALSGRAADPVRVSAADERRIGRVLRRMERHSDDSLDLDRLAGMAGLSKFHFLRLFRRIAGVTPHHYLVTLRLRRAALRLLATPDTVSAIAFDSGFGDLSTFNATFRAAFGASPSRFRRMARR